MYNFQDFQSAFSHWDQYYAQKYHWPGVYSLETMVSELLVSYNAPLFFQYITKDGCLLPFDCNHCYFLVSGLSRRIYSGDAQRFRLAAQELFLQTIKPRLDFSALDYVLSFCNYTFSTACTTYRLPFSKNFLRQDFYSIEQCCAALCAQAKQLIADIEGTGTRLGYISREALRYIHTHYAEPISLQDISAFVNVVPSYVSRVFRRETGHSIIRYINELRIGRVKELLATSDMKIKDVASAAGFPNVKYMLRLFHEREGLSPQEYRVQHKAPSAPPPPIC